MALTGRGGSTPLSRIPISGPSGQDYTRPISAYRRQLVRDCYAAFAIGDQSDVSGGGRGRNTEVLTFADEDKIAGTEVYFGWNLE